MLRLTLLVALALPLLGCGDDDRGDAPDTTDAGRWDATVPVDAASPTDADPTTDAGEEEIDAGGEDDDAGPTSCDDQPIGVACTGSCTAGYECQDGRCVPPSSRAGCGGFAGADCEDAAFPHCLYFDSSDYGPCLSAAERACACEHPDLFACP
jgi:hypothetical protein